MQYVEPWDTVSVSSKLVSIDSDHKQESTDLLALGEKAVLTLHPAPSEADVLACVYALMGK